MHVDTDNVPTNFRWFIFDTKRSISHAIDVGVRCSLRRRWNDIFIQLTIDIM